MLTSLVTGGAGFIGSHIAHHLKRIGHDVVVMDDWSGGYTNNMPSVGGHLTVYHDGGSVTDADAVNALFDKFKPTYVFHFAAYAAENLSHSIRVYNYTNNLVGSANIVNACVNHNVKRIVFASSAAVYGHAAIDADETRPVRPADPYGVAKYAVELDLDTAAEKFGLEYTAFRMHNVFGPKQNLTDGYRNCISIFIRECLQGQPMTVFGDGTQTRQFTYIDDIVDHIVQSVNMVECRDRVINIGDDVPRSVNDVALAVAKACGVEPRIEYLPERQEAHDVQVNHHRYKRIFGTVQITDFEDALADTVAWARTQTLGTPRAFANIEIEKGLPESWKELAK